MWTILRLYFEFFKTGLFAVGGGLATLPFLYEMAKNTGWFTGTDVADMIAISESTPGAIGINMSTYAGYLTAGIPGGIVATLGLATPCVIIILIIARFLQKFRDSKYVARAFYGLRPASIALICVAGINVVRTALIDLDLYQSSGSLLDLFKLPAILFFIVLFAAQHKLKWHPIIFIAISALVGIVCQL